MGVTISSGLSSSTLKCGSCRDVESELAKVIKLLSARQVEVHVAKADLSQDKDRTKTSLGDRYQLQKLPTLITFEL